jgi:hypothetical protein
MADYFLKIVGCKGQRLGTSYYTLVIKGVAKIPIGWHIPNLRKKILLNSGF